MSNPETKLEGKFRVFFRFFIPFSFGTMSPLRLSVEERTFPGRRERFHLFLKSPEVPAQNPAGWWMPRQKAPF